MQVFRGIKEHLPFFLVQVYLFSLLFPQYLGICVSIVSEKKYWIYSKICILKDSFKHSMSYFKSSFIVLFLLNMGYIPLYQKVKIIKCISPIQILKFTFQYSWCSIYNPWQRSSPYLSNFFKVPGILGLLELNPIKIYLKSLSDWTKYKFVYNIQ